MNLTQFEITKAIEAEKAILGALMLYHDNPEIMAKITERLDDPDFFGLKVHRDIFKAVLSLYRTGKPTDVISVYQWLAENNLFKNIDSINFLNELTGWASVPCTIDHHVKLVSDTNVRRKTEQFAQKLVEICNTPGYPIDEILLSAEKGLVNISNITQGDNTSIIEDLLPDVKDDFDQIRSGRETGLLTGYSDLDRKTNGFHPGELIILAARPSVGKSAFALNIAENLIRRSIPIGLISLEMTKLENAKRIVLSRAKAPVSNNKNSLLVEEEWRRIDNTIQELKGAPLYINDQTDLSITRLKSIATKMRLNYKIELLIIDYLQLLTSGQKRSTQNEEISIISRSLKILSGSLHIPVLAISQLSRAVESRGKNAKPRLSDLRDSGALEQDADIVLFLNPKAKDEYNCELIIAKHRNGPRGVINFYFIKDYVRWELGTWKS